MNSSYKPSTIGKVSLPDYSTGLKVTIAPKTDAYTYGDEVSFTLLAQNVSSKTIYLPRDPQFRFCWVYPNGRRDNYVFDTQREKYYLKKDLIRIEPGQAVRFSKQIETYYFPKRGITEFYALFTVPRNANPNIRGVWTGETESNRYGVLIDKSKRVAAYERQVQEERVEVVSNSLL